MGVSATGKSTVAVALADRLGLEFVEGDDLHPQANIEKMSAGKPLNDEDRLPWLQAIADVIAAKDAAGVSTVVTCSALRRSYRDILRSGGCNVFFVHLHADFDVLLERMGTRSKHFMPASLLESQFDTLEQLEPDEAGGLVDVRPPLEEVVDTVVQAVRPHLEG